MKEISKWGKKQNMCKKQFETEQKLQPSVRQTYELLHNSHKFSLLMWTYCSFLQHSHSYTTEVIRKMCIVLLFFPETLTKWKLQVYFTVNNKY